MIRSGAVLVLKALLAALVNTKAPSINIFATLPS